MTVTIHKNPLVSIIIITYNSARYISDALESAYNQTYRNIELIVSDDGSSDNTVKICQKWIDQKRKRFVQVKLISSQSNTGIPANCNRGLYAAKGKWIKLFAGDDILIHDCIENNLKYIFSRNETISFLFSKFKILKEDIIIRNHPRILFYRKVESNFRKNPKKQFLSLLNVNFIPAPTSFINRNSLLSLGAFDESYKYMEDYPLWLNATSNGYSLNFDSTSTTVIYRQSESSLTDNYNEKFVSHYEEVINKYFSKSKIFRYPFYYLDYRITYYNRKRHVEGKPTFPYLTLIINPVAIIRIIKKRYNRVRKMIFKL